MPGEFYFMSMGGLGLSLAGFAGLLAALTPRKAAASPVTKWRITHIVMWGLQLTVVGFGVVAIYSVVQDAVTTARLASAMALLIHVARVQEIQPGPAWPEESKRKFAKWFTVALGIFLAGNVVLGSVGYLHVIMLVLFAGPASVFATGVKEIFDDAGRETKALPDS
jgi:hypothetical protein